MMNEFAEVIIYGLCRASLGLALAAVVLEFIIRRLQIRVPRVEQVVWAFVLAQGLWLVQVQIRIPVSGMIPSDVQPEAAAVTPSFLDEASDSPSIRESTDADAGSPAAVRPEFSRSAPIGELTSNLRHKSIRTLIPVAFTIWLMGVVCLVSCAIVRYRVFSRRLRTARNAPDGWSAEWTTLLSEGGVTTSIPMVVSDSCGPALVRLPTGYRLVVPETDWTQLDDLQRRAVLRHELAHYLRRDLWTVLACRSVALVHWFNPAAWWAASQFEKQAEYLCDQFAAGDNPEYFASALIQLGCSRSHSLLAVRSVRDGSLTNRVRRLLNDVPRKGRWRAVIVMTLAALSVIPTATRWQRVSAQDQAKPSEIRSAVPHAHNGPIGDAPPQFPTDDDLPKGAVLRLGSDRFRQEGEVRQVQYSHDGKTMASISHNSIILWDPHTGRQRKRLRAPGDARFSQSFIAMSFSPDGEEIAAATKSRVIVSDVTNAIQLLSFPIDPELRFNENDEMCYSPNGEQLAVTAMKGVVLFDMETGKPIKQLTIENHRAAFNGICWTPDGTHVLSATLDPAVVAWNVASGELVRRFEVKKDPVFSRSPAMSTDGKTLIAATRGAVDFWEFATGTHVKGIELGADHINTLVLTPDNQTLIVGSQDGFIRKVNTETREVMHKIDGRLWLGRSIAVSPDFQTVALGAVFPTIRQWDLKTGEEKFPEFTATGHDAEVRCVVYSPDGQLIASGGPNKQINLWDANTGKLRIKISTPSSANRIAFTPSGQKLLTSWENHGAIRVWDVASGKEVRIVESGMKRMKTFAVSSDGKQLLSVASDAPNMWHGPNDEDKVQVWDLESGAKIREFAFETASTESVALSRNGKSLVTGASNGIIHVFDTESGKELATLPGHEHSVDSVAFSSDGTLLASGSTDQMIYVWDAQTWTKRQILRGHKRAVTSVAFVPNRHILVSGSGKASYPLFPVNSQTIRIWDVDSGEQIAALSGHDTNTSAIAVAPDGQRMVSAHDNTTLLIWDIPLAAGR